MKKYELEESTKVEYNGISMCRIKALMNFTSVNGRFVSHGDLGGFIEKEGNLSQEGICWIFDDARVFNEAHVFDSAVIEGKANVLDSATIGDSVIVSEDALVFGDAEVFGSTFVSGCAEISGKVRIIGKSRILDNAKVFGMAFISSAMVSGHACVYGKSRVLDGCIVTDNAKVWGSIRLDRREIIKGSMNILRVWNDAVRVAWGSNPDSLTFHKGKNCEMVVIDKDTWYNTIDDFREYIDDFNSFVKGEIEKAITIAEYNLL